MFSLCWLRERGLTRARPSARRAAKAVALGCLVASALLQTGCRSGGFGSGCGLFSPCGFPARAASKIVQPFKRIGSGFSNGFGACSDGCGGGCESSMTYAAPMGVVTEGVSVGGPTVISPGATVPSTVAPADAPTDLEAIPSARPDVAPSRSRSGTNSGVRTPTSNRDVQRPVQNPDVSLTGSLVPTPSARTASAKSRLTSDPADLGDIFDNLPSVEPPPPDAVRGDSPPATPAAVKTDSSAHAPTPATTSATPHDPIGGRADVPAGSSAATVAPATVASSAPVAAPAPEVERPANEAVGIAKFHAVDPKLAGGSVPTTVGLGWLADRNYKTILDLRDPSKIDMTILSEASKRNLRYVSLPTDLAKLDRGALNRFCDELALDAARPLYFFDEDGRVAGALWYIRSILVENKKEWDVARRDAESLGLDAASWTIAREFVDAALGVKPPASPAPAPAATPAAPKQAQAEPPAAAAVPTPPASPVAVLAPRDADVGFTPPSDTWKPLAAMLVTGLTFRAAFIGRAAIPTILSRSRASLPAPEPRS